MANSQFAEYATSTAFALQLSKNQCNALLRVATRGQGENFPFHTVGTLRTLEARGLVFWHRDASGKASGFGGLTRAGRIMVLLLREAGLTVENTNTVSVLRRMGRRETA